MAAGGGGTFQGSHKSRESNASYYDDQRRLSGHSLHNVPSLDMSRHSGHSGHGSNSHHHHGHGIGIDSGSVKGGGGGGVSVGSHSHKSVGASLMGEALNELNDKEYEWNRSGSIHTRSERRQLVSDTIFPLPPNTSSLHSLPRSHTLFSHTFIMHSLIIHPSYILVHKLLLFIIIIIYYYLLLFIIIIIYYYYYYYLLLLLFLSQDGYSESSNFGSPGPFNSGSLRRRDSQSRSIGGGGGGGGGGYHGHGGIGSEPVSGEGTQRSGGGGHGTFRSKARYTNTHTLTHKH